jgi:GAF domain-containing protein
MMTDHFSFPLPADEAERLQALADLQILDTKPEPSFDRITDLAKILFDMHACAISLVDHDRQWFKSSFGFGCTEMPREQSFCTYTILSDEPLILPDTALHPMFKNHPLVTGEPHVRFYAGIPLNTRAGSKVGALCVLDTKPRPDWNRLRTKILSDLAALVCDQLESRSRQQRVEYLTALNDQLHSQVGPVDCEVTSRK